MTDQESVSAPKRRLSRSSSVIMFAAIADLVVVLPCTYWLLNDHGLAVTIVLIVEAIGTLSLLGIGLRLSRRGL